MTINAFEAWRALSRRIRGLIAAGQLCKPNDSYGTIKNLGVHAQKIVTDLESFREGFKHCLPLAALSAIQSCVGSDVDVSVAKLLGDTTTTNDLRQEQIWAALVMLAAFETEMTFILSDVQASIRALSERAFSHLQRLIVVDSVVRERWTDALSRGEVACEQLGAVHLLWHGIWAFKVNGTGERTDLVYQEPADDGHEKEHFAQGLVLTEWKVAKPDDQAEKKFREARDQAQRYANGVLAGNELRTLRYVVVVSADHVPVPKDTEDQAVIYRHINIAASPSTPSQSSKRA